MAEGPWPRGLVDNQGQMPWDHFGSQYKGQSIAGPKGDPEAVPRGGQHTQPIVIRLGPMFEAQ